MSECLIFAGFVLWTMTACALRLGARRVRSSSCTRPIARADSARRWLRGCTSFSSTTWLSTSLESPLPTCRIPASPILQRALLPTAAKVMDETRRLLAGKWQSTHGLPGRDGYGISCAHESGPDRRRRGKRKTTARTRGGALPGELAKEGMLLASMASAGKA